MAILDQWLSVLAGMIISSTLLGCQIEREVGHFPEQMRPGGEAAGSMEPAGLNGEPDGPLEDVNGYWMLYVEDRVCIESALVGDPTENIIWSQYLVKMEGSAENAVIQHSVRLCGQELSPLPLDLRTVVPKALTDGLPTRTAVGFLVGGERGAAYVTESFSDLWGVDALEAGESLPTDVDDPRLSDQDGDGLPGVTLQIANEVGDAVCEVYVVQQTQLQLEGSVLSPRRIEGTVRSIPAKEVLDASSALCSSGDLSKSQADSVFYLVRVDGQQGSPSLDKDGDKKVDCDELRRGREEVLREYSIGQSEPDGQYCSSEGE